MTLSDDDKQFIKDAINYRMKRGSDKSYTSDTESGKKLSKIELDEREKKNRELLLKELQERDKKGENTIAQKVEMLNLSLKTAVPDDFKEAMKQTGLSVKKGATQAMSGLSHLTNRAMMSNPLTAMIWQNRDIIQALGDIGIGSVKAVGGAVAGIGKGAAGLVNASINMFKKKKQQQEEVPEDEVPEYQEPKTRNEFNEEEEVLEENQPKEEKADYNSMAEKINEIHDYIFKDQPKEKKEQQKEQESQKTLLSKGLDGLGKSMKAVSGFVEAIQEKQKLIVTGVMLGTIALLGLASWFKNGGLSKLLNQVPGVTPSSPDVKSTDFYNTVKNNAYKTRDDRLDDLTSMVSKEQKTGKIEEVKKTTTVNVPGAGKHGVATPLTSGYKMKANAGQPYRAPFDLKCINWQANTKNKESIDMEVERTSTLTKKNAVIMNIEDPQIVPGQTAKQGQIIGRVPALGQIFIKDITKEEFQTYKNLIDKKAGQSTQDKAKELAQAKEFMDYNQSNKVRNAWSALEKQYVQNKNGNRLEHDGKLDENEAKKYTEEQAKAKQGFAAETDPKKETTISAAKDQNIFAKTITPIKAKMAADKEWDRSNTYKENNVSEEKINDQIKQLNAINQQTVNQQNVNANGKTSGNQQININPRTPSNLPRQANLQDTQEAQDSKEQGLNING